jgi:hypothetical protein
MDRRRNERAAYTPGPCSPILHQAFSQKKNGATEVAPTTLIMG